MLLALAHLIVASIFAPARAASPDALALVHEWETVKFPNGILDYFRRSAIENLAAELHIDETLSTKVVDRFVVPALTVAYAVSRRHRHLAATKPDLTIFAHAYLH
jgi:hypothetical protein